MKRKSFVLFLSAVLAAINGFSSSITVSGDAEGVWNTDTVFIVGDVRIPAGKTLSVEPGTLILFAGHYRIEVKGNILALGSTTDLIRFTAQDTASFFDTTTTNGGWYGFFFDHLPSFADSTIFSFCIFEFGKAVADDTTGLYGGVIRAFNFSRIRFENCTFRNNLAYRWGGAVYLNRSDVIFLNCRFSENICGEPGAPYGYGGGICSVSSSPKIEGCYFDNNRSTGVGGGASFEYSDPELTHNIFTGNFSGLGGALAFLRADPTRVVSNNLVHGNESAFFGGGICVIRNSTVFSNMTITENTTIYGGGLYCNDSAVPTIYNSIIYGNTSYGPGEEIYIWDVRSAPNFYYSNIRYSKDSIAGSGGNEGYHGLWENNLDTVPGFSGIAPLPFSLVSGSPMTDAGTPDTTGLQIPVNDLQGKTRLYNGRIDIGTYEYSPAEGITFMEKDTYLHIFPNPASEYADIRIKDINDDFRFTITGIDCRTVYESEGKGTFRWNCCDFNGRKVPEGLYIINISSGSILYSGRIMITD